MYNRKASNYKHVFLDITMLNAQFKKCKFIAGITKAQHIPQTLCLKEIAFAGRANVGKSSLLNALTLQKDLARTSKTPGRTQQINFFSIEKFITLVDLPGYGYSKVSRSTISQWAALIANYVSCREHLQQVFLLIDARRSLKENDLAVIKWLESYTINYTIVLTKADKVNSIELSQVQSEIMSTLQELSHSNKEIIITSTTKKIGLDKLRHVISTYSK